jgi:hypothetical protein
MPDLISVVIGSACVATGVVLAALQFRRLRTRRASRLWQVVTASSGFFVRQALLTAACGLWLATHWWPVVVIEVAIIAWIVAVWAVARVRRARRSPRTS